MTSLTQPLKDHYWLPKLVTVLQEGYGLAQFRRDAIAGLTVAIVALPLSMAIAIASHAPPQTGLAAAIIGGFIVSALGGSRFQIGGPAGAFIVLVASIIDRQGFDGLMLATMMAGVVMVVAGLSRLGGLVRHVPHAVTVGFTAGIAVIIFASQIRDLFGLTITGAEPGELIEKIPALWSVRDSMNISALMISVLAMAIIIMVRRYRPTWPALLLAVAVATGLAFALKLPVETIQSRFGGIPATLPWPHLPAWSMAKVIEVLPDALALALLGAIESLLSAMVADGMSGRRHRSNTELVAQGAANIVAPLFGGITVTGTIARTATNVKAGAHGPVSGMLHAAYLMAFMALAAPLIAMIPLAALAGILAIVAFNMVEWHHIRRAGGSAVLAVIFITFAVTIFRDLISGIAAGMVLAFIIQAIMRRRAP